MADNQYVYAVARIRSKELTLLDKQFFDQLMSCKTYTDCLRLLSDKGWGYTGGEKEEELIAIEREKTWNLIRELVKDMSVFDTFLYENDFHNLKAAIKQVYINKEMPDIYLTNGTMAPEIIYQSIRIHDFTALPEHLKRCAEEAYEVQMHTGDSQLCDIIIDKEALEAINRKGKSSGNALLSGYAELKVAAADINIAVRGHKTGKNAEYLNRAIAECKSLDKQRLIAAAVTGMDALYEYLSSTAYEAAVREIKKSSSAFEKWFDNQIINYIKPQKYNSFTLSPIAAYILARENEIKSVRILLSGRRNNLPVDSIRERLREMYV